MDAASIFTALITAAAGSALTWWLTTRSVTQKLEPIVRGLQADLVAAGQLRQRETEEAKAKLDHALGEFGKLEQEHNAYVQESTARAGHQSRRISELEVSLHSSGQALRELEQQLPHALKRIADLEANLTAEKGRAAALEKALDVKSEQASKLKAELETLHEEQAAVMILRDKREADLMTLVAEHEKTLAELSSSDLAGDLEKMKAALAAKDAETESKLADMKRRLAASENKNQLLQKEIMTLVSADGASAAAATVVDAEQQEAARENLKHAQKKILELEAKLAQSDSETRKKLREAEYRVCELEFKLAQADEKNSGEPPAKA